MIILVHFILFICGLLLGSFFNVVTIRYNPDTDAFMSPRVIGGRSRCIECGRTLRWFELFPLISFLFLRGKCRTCGVPLSLQYPIVEFLTGCIFVGVPLFFHSFFGSPYTVFYSLSAPWLEYVISLLWIMVFCVFLLMVIIDIKHLIIPNGLNITLGILGIVYVAVISFVRQEIPLFFDSFTKHYAMIFSFSNHFVYSHAVGLLAGGFFFMLLVLLTWGRGIGMGDVKLACTLGILFGWPDIIFIIMLSFILGGVVSGCLVLLKKKHLKERIPFAPFFIAGAVGVLFFGYDMLQLYFGLFRL